jgi:hypothetical protein
MPHTMAALLAPRNNSAYAPQPAALALSHNPVVQPLPPPSKKPRLTGPAAHPATPAPIIPTPKGGKGKGGKGKDGKAGKATGTPIVIGSGKHLVRYTDSSGTTHHDQTLNLFCCVGKKKVLISGVRSEFAADAPIACIPCLMSHLFGDLRFTVCDQHLTDPANHGTFTSAAHRFPGDYKRRMRGHFH